MSVRGRERAVVLGGSVAGLLTASALADSYRSVVVVERDVLPSHPGHRRGVPHGRHAHGILPSGLRLIEELLPGLTAGLVAQGALRGDILGNVRWYLNGRLLRQAETGLTALSASRPLIETAIRAAVRRRANVTVLDGYDIVGIGTTPDRRRVVSARVTGCRGEGSRVLPADLVVDCTGRASRAPRWLADLGYSPPGEDVVGIDLSYATRVFAMPAGPFGDDLFVATTRFPGRRRSAIAQRLEGGRALVTLAGVLGERPPADLDSFTAYARTLAVPDTYEIVRAGTPLGEPATFRCPTYVRRRFERLADFPAGFLAVGDAVCAFNPVYGQGMSVAAAEAKALDDCLAAGVDGLAGRFFPRAKKIVESPWTIATGEDFKYPQVKGKRPPGFKLVNSYMGRAHAVCTKDPVVLKQFFKVANLLAPPTSMMSPRIAWRVALGGRGEQQDVPSTVAGD